MTSLVRISTGLLFVLLGIAGMVLPILQGWLFLGIGVVLLAADIPLFAKLLCWIENLHPRLHNFFDRLRGFSSRTGKAIPPCANKD